MTLRVLRAYEPGNYTAGLVGVSFPDENSTVPEDAQLLVSIHEPGKSPTSFQLTGNAGETQPVAYGSLLAPLADLRVRPEKKQKKRWISMIVYALLITLFAVMAFVGLSGIVSMRVVLTNSMEPSIKPGDVIVTVSDNYLQPKLGDVVVYTATNFDGEPIAPFAHRIVGGDAESGWVVKGDNNAEADVQMPTSKDIESVSIATLPQIGKFLNVQFMLLVALSVFGIWLIVDGVRGRK
jgi:signal peptidase I